MTEEAVRDLLDERIEGEIEALTWTRSSGPTHYGVVISRRSETVALTTIILDAAEETLRIHSDNSMWIPADPDVTEALLRGLGRTTTRLNNGLSNEEPLTTSLTDWSASELLSYEIEDDYDPDTASASWQTDEGPEQMTTLRARFVEAGIEPVDRFIRLEWEGKAPWSGETKRTMRPPEEIAGNYGIEVGGADPLIILDVDDREVAPLSDLPDTLRVISPHDGEHHYLRADGWAEVFRERFDGTLNPHPAWGEIRASDGYVVGPGSILTECKHGCCTEEEPGEYLIDDQPIAEIEASELADLLAGARRDPA